MVEMILGGKVLAPGSEQPARFSSLIWGQPGCGKTTLAATAPGKKLWLNFDPDGPSSITGLAKQHKDTQSALRHEIYVHDLSGENNRIVESFKKDDHLGLGKLLADDSNGIETVVVDSMTRVSQMATEATLVSGNHGKSTIEKPGISVYQGRNALTYRVFVDVFMITKRYNKNVIFITHEAGPTTNDAGEILFITMALGGQLPILGSAQVSEVWHMTDSPQGRRLAVRPCRGFKPMKTRLFNATNSPEFNWTYDIEKPDTKMEIATWWNDWKENGGQKIVYPK